jgi:hypothetical protein
MGAAKAKDLVLLHPPTTSAGSFPPQGTTITAAPRVPPLGVEQERQ